MASGPSDKKTPLLARLQTLPIDQAEADWENVSYRDRVRAIFKMRALANYSFPVLLLVVFYLVVGVIRFAVFWFLVRDASQDFFSDKNMRKFILYNVLHGVLGFGATCGPLGSKITVPFGNAALIFLTPGTLCSPLLPGVVGLFQRLPGKRSLVQVLLYVAYISALVYAILDPSFKRVTIVNSVLAMATVGDFTIFQASRGEHYGYMMICLSFPDWIAGCQWVQLMLSIMVGVSKCGPWFKYAIQVLVKDAIWTPFLPEHFSAKLFNKDPLNNDWTPTRVTTYLGHLGAVGEWVFPLFCVLGSPGSTVNVLGVVGMIGYHIFIWSTLPSASVFEWQYYAIVMTYFLYGLHPFHLPTSPFLLVFLGIVLFVIPIVGWFRPTLVPFFMGYRQYSGNWRFSSFLLKKSARAKFDKLKTYESLYIWEKAPKELGGERFMFYLLSPFMVVPQFRGCLSIMDNFFEKTGTTTNDFWELVHAHFVNCVMGWNLGGSWEICREFWRKAIVEICSLEPGDMYMVTMEPVSLFKPHNLAYRVMDMTKGPLDAEIFASVPYAELEGPHPMKVDIKPEHIKSGRSITGLFLDSYYI